MGYNPSNAVQSNSVMGAGSKIQSHHTQVNQTKRSLAPQYGTIVDVKITNLKTQAPWVRLRWKDDDTKVSGWIPLEDHPNLIAAVYASDLKDLIGVYTVKVTSRTSNVSAGVGRIVADVNFNEENYDPLLPSTGVKL